MMRSFSFFGMPCRRLAIATALLLLLAVFGGSSAHAEGDCRRQAGDTRVTGVAAPRTENEADAGGEQPIAVVPSTQGSTDKSASGSIRVDGWQGARNCGDTFAIRVTGQSGAPVRFITSNCTVEPSTGSVGDSFTVRVGRAGTYAMTAVATAAGGELSAALTGSAGKADQAPLTINGWGAERNYYQSFDIQVLGGTTNGTISFETDGCTVSPAVGTRQTLFTVTVTRTGAYALTAVMTGDANYAEAYSAQQSGMANKAAQHAIEISGWESEARYGDVFSVSITGGSTNEATTIAAAGCTVTRVRGYEYEVKIDAVGPYSLTASRAGNYGYTATTASVCGVATQAEQPALSVTGWSPEKNYGDGFPVHVRGGIEGGLVEFNAVGCTVSPLTGTVNTSFIVTVNTVGAYSLTAYMGGTANYLSANTHKLTGSSDRGAQPKLRADGWIENAAAGDAFEITLGGGGGTGGTRVSTYGGCTAMLKAGTTNVYTVRVNAATGEEYSLALQKAGDANYNDANQVTYTGICGSTRQSELTVLGWRQDEQTGGTFTITLSGGSGNGKVSFDTEGCRVVPESGAIGDTYSVTVTAQEGAGYALTVNHAADGGYAHASTLRSGSAQLAAQSAQRAQNLRRQQEPRPSANEADTLLLICGVLLIGIVAILTLIVGRKAFRRR